MKTAEAGDRAQAGCRFNPRSPWLIWNQRQAWNVPGKMMHRVGGCKDHTASGRKSKSDQAVARNFQASLALGCDLHNAALARKRRSHIQVAERVECQALQASQAAEKCMHRALRIDSVDTVET